MSILRFKEIYQSVKSQLQQEYNYINTHQIPKIEKVVINMGVGRAAADAKFINNAINDLTLISGQKPMTSLARKSIANYKLREGMKIGCKATLRGGRMYDFLERLQYVVLPRTKDFRGFNFKSFDGKGNFSFGIKEQIVFPEINYDKIDVLRGMDITIVTSANTDKEAKSLLIGFGFPFIN